MLDYLEDIDSDMSAFHRVDDARTTMPVGLYFERAERLAAYPGVIRARVLEEAQREGGNAPSNGGKPGSIVVDDTILLNRLADEGWVEHVVTDTGEAGPTP